MRRMPGVLGAVFVLALAAAPTSMAATDWRGTMIGTLHDQIKVEHGFLGKLKEGFEVKDWWKEGQSKADKAAADLVSEILQARTELASVNVDATLYLNDAKTTLSESKYRDAQFDITNIREQVGEASSLDRKAAGAPLERVVADYVKDPQSQGLKSRVDAEVEVMTKDLEKAIRAKERALSDANRLPKLPIGTTGACTQFAAAGQPLSQDPNAPIPKATLTFTCDLGTHPVPSGQAPMLTIRVTTTGHTIQLVEATRNSTTLPQGSCGPPDPADYFSCTEDGANAVGKGNWKFAWQSLGPSGFEATCNLALAVTVTITGSAGYKKELASHNLTALC